MPASMNNDIALFKFIYCWYIVFYHFFQAEDGLFIGGYYGVEFYVLVAGIFFFRAYERQAESGSLMTPGEYFKKRFSRLFPWAFTAFLFTLLLVRRTFFLHGFSFETLLDFFSDDIWEILLLKWNGMNIGNSLMLNVPAWTMSSLLLVGFFLWCVLYYHHREYLGFIMPVSLLIGYGFWRHLPEAYAGTWVGFTTVGTLRTYLAMCMGYYSLQLSKKLADIPFNDLGSFLLSIVELIGHGFLIFAMLNRDTRNYQWLCTLVIFLVCAIALSGKSTLCRVLNRSRFIPYLQKLSLSVYLVHFGTFELYHLAFGESKSALHLAALVGMIIVVSVCHKLITEQIIALHTRLWPRFLAKITSRESLTSLWHSSLISIFIPFFRKGKEAFIHESSAISRRPRHPYQPVPVRQP